MASTNSASYTTPTTNLSRPETYQIKVAAQFVNGNTSPEAVGPEITLHYYNDPKLSVSVLDRGQDTVTLKTSVSPSTSLPNPIGSVTLTYGGSVDQTTTTTTAPPFVKSFEEQKVLTGLEETEAGTVSLSYKDSVMSAILSTPTTIFASVEVPLWVPLLTIREKGVGVNAIAGDFADLMAKGTGLHLRWGSVGTGGRLHQSRNRFLGADQFVYRGIFGFCRGTESGTGFILQKRYHPDTVLSYRSDINYTRYAYTLASSKF